LYRIGFGLEQTSKFSLAFVPCCKVQSGVAIFVPLIDYNVVDDIIPAGKLMNIVLIPTHHAYIVGLDGRTSYREKLDRSIWFIDYSAIC
jgi:hypothetical protein